MAYMRAACRANATVQQQPLLFEFTRKKFHDPFPLPFVKQDVAMFLLVRGLYAWIGYVDEHHIIFSVAKYLH
jgi:hypothetical protein